jgi:putative ATP-dependent endonuclease of OLD family
MKIVSFAVNNYRGISGGLEPNRIDFQGINTLFIFGQNNTGKSTFLKAYDFFYHDELPGADDFYRKNTDNKIEIQIEVELDEWDRERIEVAAPNAKESYKAYLIDGSRLRLKNEWIPDGTKVKKNAFTWSPADADFVEIGYASVGLHGVFQSCLPRPIKIKAMPNEEEAKAILNEVLKAVAESRLKDKELKELRDAREKIRELQDRMYKKDAIEKYQQSVNSYMGVLFPSVRVAIEDTRDRVAWTENKLGREYDISFQNIDPSGNVDAALPNHAGLIGHGTIRTAIFTLLLMRDVAEEFERIGGRKDYLVLFEEPELFLYPKVIRDLRDLVYKVSEGDTPYQVLCASHSPSMIDITQLKSSIIRLVKDNGGTRLHQVSDAFLKSASGTVSDADFKQEMYEVLRFNPYICEAFYADEVILVEGPTEEIVLRAYLQELPQKKFFFILNCGTVTNIPFYQKVLAKFAIRYSVICDTDGLSPSSTDPDGDPVFESGIQRAISEQFQADRAAGKVGVFGCHDPTFEPAHRVHSIPEGLRMPPSTSNGKPFDANKYWKEILKRQLSSSSIAKVPIISIIRRITGWNETAQALPGDDA